MSNKKITNNDFKSIDMLIENTFDRLKDIVDTNTVIGSTIELTEKLFIIPISKVSVGLISGGGEFPIKNKKTSVNACSTSGFTVTPMGFITINDTIIDFIGTGVTQSNASRALDTFFSIYEKMILKNNGEKDEEN